MLSGLSSGLKIILGVQLVISLVFLALGWSQTSSLQFGRTPALVDILALAAPAALVILGALLAASAARRGQKGMARICAILPIPLAILLAMLAGVV